MIYRYIQTMQTHRMWSELFWLRFIKKNYKSNIKGLYKNISNISLVLYFYLNFN